VKVDVGVRDSGLVPRAEVEGEVVVVLGEGRCATAAAGRGQGSHGSLERRPGWDVERAGTEADAEGGEDRYTQMDWPSPNGHVCGWARRPDHRPPSLYQMGQPLRPCGCDNPLELYYYGVLAVKRPPSTGLGGMTDSVTGGGASAAEAMTESAIHQHVSGGVGRRCSADGRPIRVITGGGKEFDKRRRAAVKQSAPGRRWAGKRAP
jgi:hypothetical protein